MFLQNIAQKMKFSVKDFFNKCDQIRSLLGCENWNILAIDISKP